MTSEQMFDIEQSQGLLKFGRCPNCHSYTWYMGPDGGMTTMYRSPCGLWVAVSPFGATIVDYNTDRYFNTNRIASYLGGDYVHR